MIINGYFKRKYKWKEETNSKSFHGWNLLSQEKLWFSTNVQFFFAFKLKKYLI